MSKVYLIEKLRQEIDTTKAAKYGEISYIFEPNTRRASIFDVEAFCCDVLKALEAKDFNPKEDAICIVGSSIAIMLSVNAILSKYKYVKLLLFSANDGEYVLRTLRRKYDAKGSAIPVSKG